jgi:hypothetical protein
MIVILIQTSDLSQFPGTLQLSMDIAVLRAVVGLNAQGLRANCKCAASA